MFQSLIGILRTRCRHDIWHSEWEFQSLIGILRTMMRMKGVSTDRMFQSLIGILRTKPLIPIYPYPHHVSIPHRYPTNSWGQAVYGVGYSVSIPHRYPTNILLISFRIRKLAEFQSLIGILRTIWGFGQNTQVGVVSIPHRYPTNPRKDEENIGKIASFQSLIGILRTMIVTSSDRVKVVFQSLIGILRTAEIKCLNCEARGSFNPS